MLASAPIAEIACNSESLESFQTPGPNLQRPITMEARNPVVNPEKRNLL